MVRAWGIALVSAVSLAGGLALAQQPPQPPPPCDQQLQRAVKLLDNVKQTREFFEVRLADAQLEVERLRAELAEAKKGK